MGEQYLDWWHSTALVALHLSSRNGVCLDRLYHYPWSTMSPAASSDCLGTFFCVFFSYRVFVLIFSGSFHISLIVHKIYSSTLRLSR